MVSECMTYQQSYWYKIVVPASGAQNLRHLPIHAFSLLLRHINTTYFVKTVVSKIQHPNAILSPIPNSNLTLSDEINFPMLLM